jgi:hypothetical protein
MEECRRIGNFQKDGRAAPESPNRRQTAMMKAARERRYAAIPFLTAAVAMKYASARRRLKKEYL